jgi:hypothetical protein
LLRQHDYQASVNAFKDSLREDGDPGWKKVWSHIQVGKIFDITGQRDRAVNEYQLALQTKDNTRRAIQEAQHLLNEPYLEQRREYSSLVRWRISHELGCLIAAPGGLPATRKFTQNGCSVRVGDHTAGTPFLSCRTTPFSSSLP